jgi:hypothetical protein
MVANRDPITQNDLDSVGSSVNTFLANITSANVLDIITAYSPYGKYGASEFAITVVYLA